MLSFHLLLRRPDSLGRATLLAAGILMGTAAVFRPNALVLLVPVFLWFYAKSRDRPDCARAAALFAAALPGRVRRRVVVPALLAALSATDAYVVDVESEGDEAVGKVVELVSDVEG